ncbi:hypothetical protein ACM614_21065 [Streptomyces sp. 12297]
MGVGAGPRPRIEGVKTSGAPVWSPSKSLSTPLTLRFARLRPLWPHPLHLFIQELTMADLAFVVTTLAVFALVALVARGVTKL